MVRMVGGKPGIGMLLPYNSDKALQLTGDHACERNGGMSAAGSRESCGSAREALVSWFAVAQSRTEQRNNYSRLVNENSETVD